MVLSFSSTGKESKMKKVHTKSRVNRELTKLDKRSLDFTKLKPDLSPLEVAKIVGSLPGRVFFPFTPIETLSPTKTLGKGRTNLTFVRPTIVQIDTLGTPFATFDIRAQPSPAISAHFEPIAYGITAPSTYVFEFTLQAFGPSNFLLGGFAGAGTLANAGVRTLNGLTTVSLIMKGVPPATHTSGFLQQTSGVAWNFLSVKLKFPDIVITQLDL